MSRGFFVTGTDTGVGKSWISVGLMEALQRQGLSVAGMKPVASGCERTSGGLRNEDALMLQRQSSVSNAYDVVNPYAFAEPIAPHIAAARAGLAIDPDIIASRYAQLSANADIVVVEGVGGWAVPLDEQQSMAALPVALHLDVVLVVGLRLGCISHALLTAQSVATDGLRLAGWVANMVDGHVDEAEAMVAALQDRLAAPLLGTVPHLAEPDARQIAPFLRVDSLALLG